jgi:hypothetical protein
MGKRTLPVKSGQGGGGPGIPKSLPNQAQNGKSTFCAWIQLQDAFYNDTIINIMFLVRYCNFDVQRSVSTQPDRTMPQTGGENGSQNAVASYVATLSNDLATLARRNGLDTLGYLLEMVRLEAESLTRPNANGNGNGNGRRG